MEVFPKCENLFNLHNGVLLHEPAYHRHTPGTTIPFPRERNTFYLHFHFFKTNLEYRINIQKWPYHQNLFSVLSMYLIEGRGTTISSLFTENIFTYNKIFEKFELQR